MPEFLKLLPKDDALELFIPNVISNLEIEWIKTSDALGRITGDDVAAKHPLPEFPRTTVDGYAVRSKDTHGASDSLPMYLDLQGEIPMGAAPSDILKPNNCLLIHTGGMLPDGADAVVMLEHTQEARQGEIEILRPAAPGENTIQIGEDVAKGDIVISRGTRLEPAEIGGLMALGILEINVFRRPKVGIISSGDEVVDPSQSPNIGQVRDVNSYTLSSLVRNNGGEPVLYGIVGDDRDNMVNTVRKAMQNSELVIVTAGSSASSRDLTAAVFDEMGDPGVLVHGVNIRPGKPTILAIANGKPLIGLPGNPVSALVIAGIFVVPVLRKLLNLESLPDPSISARMEINFSSGSGRQEWLPVRLKPSADGYLAEPIFGKSNLIFRLVRANGLVVIPPNSTGLEVGQLVDVYPF